MVVIIPIEERIYRPHHRQRRKNKSFALRISLPSFYLTATALGVEEDHNPPLTPFNSTLIRGAIPFPSMLLFKYLGPDLILPLSFFLPCPVDFVTAPLLCQLRLIVAQSALADRRELLVTVTCAGKFIFRKNTVFSYRAVKRSHCACEKQGCQK